MLNRIIRRLKLIYSSLPWARGAIKRLSGSRPYFWFVSLKIRSQKQKDLRGPFNLVIETSNFCNAKCLMCPHPAMERQKGRMTEAVFQRIVERVKSEKVPLNKVFFSGLGEPLSDPDLLYRIEAFKKLDCRIRLYTNASLLTEAVARRLVELGLDEMNISFNGTNPEQYRQIMNLDFERTRSNIERLLELRRQKQSQKPIIQVSLILLGENERDVNQHLKNWQEKVESVTVSLAHSWGGGVKLNEKFKMKNEKSTYPCRSLWHTFMIDWQGNFVVCCRDFESHYILGNISTHSFAHIQDSPILETFRRQHLLFSKEKLPAMCQQCNFPYQDGVEWFLPRSID